jgi:3-oxo-5alpha-steroid 4-dehydrogenase
VVTTTWDDRADVVLVGFGGAGACAAIEAAGRGADVLVLDRFTGGGATAVSGGVVYAGGGTAIQREAGVPDSAQAMFDYLSQEVGDAVSAATLRRFCDGSAELIDWLQTHGVPFQASPCPYKTSYPTNEFYLYQSGSESAWPFREHAAPAARGHRAHGPGTSGRVLFAALESSARAAGARILPHTSAERLVTDETGRVVGVECRTLSGAPERIRRRHARLYRYATKPGLYVPALARRLARRITAIERRYARPYRVAATRGVVLAAGGFIGNRAMLREHAPAFRGGLPLGTLGDDGSGITMGAAVGGAVDRLDSVSAWRFLNPPSALLGGVLVNAAGRRFIDESSYGAAIGHAMITEQSGRAWLVIDRRVLCEARAELSTQTLWFQRMQARYLLGFGRVSGSLERVAARSGVDLEGLRATLAAYGGPDEFGKHPDLVRPLTEAPYSVIDCSSRPRIAYPCPMLTLGGLLVDESTGQVLTGSGDPVPGLYAAGRTAVGICSASYVSGLSLADCVFSGRRAGTAVADMVAGVGDMVAGTGDMVAGTGDTGV